MHWHIYCIYTNQDNTEDTMKTLIKKLEDIMVAITFAEAGEFDQANRELGNTVSKEDAAQQLHGIDTRGALKSMAK
jgi:hypothetical protein